MKIRNRILKLLVPATLVAICISIAGCAGGGGGGNLGGTEPVNEEEAIQYKQAILRCYKTGGTRVVKIQGYLRCF